MNQIEPSFRTPEDPWTDLRQWTNARIAIGRAGGSLPTRHVLDFRLAHASARDAVQKVFDHETLATDIRAIPQEVILMHTQATTRIEHLRRPDKGRILDDDSCTLLQQIGRERGVCDLSIAVSDGLSSAAAERQVIPVLNTLLPLLSGWKLAPIILAPFGRVALQDQIGSLLRARLSLMLIGERPGLKSPESLGAYLVHTPAPAKTDADRNCISNIHSAGVPPEEAAQKIILLLSISRQLGFSGVNLKDPSVHALP